LLKADACFFFKSSGPDSFAGDDIGDVFHPEIDHVNVSVSVKGLVARGGFEVNCGRNQGCADKDRKRYGDIHAKECAPVVDHCQVRQAASEALPQTRRGMFENFRR